MPGEFENLALVLRLGLPSSLVRHENGAFRKARGVKKHLLYVLVWTENNLKTKLFQNDFLTIIVIFPLLSNRFLIFTYFLSVNEVEEENEV